MDLAGPARGEVFSDSVNYHVNHLFISSYIILLKKKLIHILFVCHGNICRSPMAEFIFKALIRARGLEADYYVESAAVSAEEIGNPIYPPAKRNLTQHGIPFDTQKRAAGYPCRLRALRSHYCDGPFQPPLAGADLRR